MGKIRVLLCDDHPALRRGVADLLNAEPDIEVVGETCDGVSALEAIQRLQPDVAVLDITMPEMDGLEATRQVRELGLRCNILILTVHDHQRYLFHVLQAGALGYVPKTAAHSELIEAVRTVANGQAFLRPDAARLLIGDYLERVGQGEERDSYAGLSERERQVLKLTAEGYSGTEIAKRLLLSANTVETYRRRSYEKLGIHNRAELVRYALAKGLLLPAE
ncbi:MAG: response regulator transcription factor [Chloroflexi bacterium]|nr:response regulator transcription factor [Chloroflexota bacterium]